MADVKTPPVRAVRVDDIDEGGAPGAFEYYRDREREVAGMIYMCPCGCGHQAALSFRPHPSPSWDWDGNRDAPTLQPSVHHVGHWHGWLRAGVWESC